MKTPQHPIRLLTLSLCAALLLAVTGCQQQPTDIRDKTAKVSNVTSVVSDVSLPSHSESSLWTPSTDTDSRLSDADSSTDSSIGTSEDTSESTSQTTSIDSSEGHPSESSPEDDASSTVSASSVTEESSESIFFHVPDEFLDGGIFSDYYEDAYRYMSQMSLEEKIGQMLFASLPYDEPIETATLYHLGGYVLFGDDFAGQTKDSVKSMLNSLSIAQKVPLAFAVDEEGGTVTRISGKPALSDHEFESPRTLYKNGGLAFIQSDADEKATLLHELGLNINLAPVCDIATNKKDFMYDRSLGQDAATTAEFVRIVTQMSQMRGVSVTLKHFPGYGQNVDTHTGIAVDKREMKAFEENDFLPFQAGIQAGAHCVMVSHNIVECMDKEHPASLSPEVHQILREQLGFSGLIMTDDLGMGAITQYTGQYTPAVAAVLAGNDVLALNSSMVDSSFTSILEAVNSGVLTEKSIDHAVLRILAWKYATALM